MRLLVDGDACPNIHQIKELAKIYKIEMQVYVDYAHEIYDDHFMTVICEIGRDSVDWQIVNECQENDLIITQDYGLASLVLLKQAKVLHVSGKMIHEDNIHNLLMSRYLGHKERQTHKHVKGPKKRTHRDSDIFLRQLEKLFIEERLKSCDE